MTALPGTRNQQVGAGTPDRNPVVEAVGYDPASVVDRFGIEKRRVLRKRATGDQRIEIEHIEWHEAAAKRPPILGSRPALRLRNSRHSAIIRGAR